MDSKSKRVISDIQKSKEPSKDYTRAMREYHKYRRGKECSKEDYSIAFDAYNDPLQKEIIEALLFGDADFEDVFSAFGLSTRSLDVYEEMFFDRTKFRNKLDKLSYLDNYPEKFGKEIKMRALNLGPEFIYYTYANIVPKSPKQRALVQRMFMASAYKAMAMNYNSMNSKVTKNAIDHAKLMLKAFDSLQKFSEEELSDEVDILKVLTEDESKDSLDKTSMVAASDII